MNMTMMNHKLMVNHLFLFLLLLLLLLVMMIEDSAKPSICIDSTLLCVETIDQ